MRVIGHRGWPVRYPENSLEGIVAASAVAEMVETDIRLTTHRELVLSHDPIESPDGLPRLEDLLGVLADFPLNLEIKNFPGEPGFDPDHRVGLDTAARARPGDLLTCFFWPTVDAIARAFPKVATGLLIDVGWDLGIAARHAQLVGHRTLAPHWSVILAEPGIARAATAAGLDLVVWTLNDPALLPELAEAGVTAIITDDPGALRAALDT